MYKRSLLIFAVLIVPFCTAFAQWAPTHLPGTREVYSLAATSSRLFAGTDYDVNYTDDNGANWYSEGIGISNFLSFVQIHGKLFTGSADFGVGVTTDDGLSWRSVNNGITDYFIASLASFGDD